ncbi:MULTISPECIES: hypothetical protein [unclassified Imperialibacter]|nr:MULTISPECIES: hypothetical protein [unclassified Imperialibacter]
MKVRSEDMMKLPLTNHYMTVEDVSHQLNYRTKCWREGAIVAQLQKD